MSILFILLLSAFLRFWNLPDLIHFTLDEELEAFIVKNIVTGYHFPAIGISVAPVGIHLSPLFYYLAAIPFWIGNLNPIAWGVTASSLGVLTTLVLYLSCKEMFSKRVSLFASFLYAGSFLMVLYDKHFWNVTPLPFLAILVIFSLYKLINGSLLWSIPLSLSLSIGLSSHLSTISLAILTILVWWRYKLPILRTQILFGIGIFIFSQLPLLFFDLRHNFSQTQALISFFTGEHSGLSFTRIMENLMLFPNVFSRLIYTFGPHDFAREHTYGLTEILARDGRISTTLLIFIVLIFIWFFLFTYKKWNDVLSLHTYLIIITLISLVFYGLLFTGNIFEFYLTLVFPSLFIMLALFLDWLLLQQNVLRALAVLLLVAFAFSNIWAVLTSYHSYGLTKKLKIINWSMQRIGTEKFELHSIGVDHKYEGYRYLFERFYKPPSKSYVDPQLSWLYQAQVDQISPKHMLVIASTEPAYLNKIHKEKSLFSPGEIDEFTIGEIEVMLIDTTKLR